MGLAYVMVERMGTRTEALAALRRLAGQGEAPEMRTASQEKDGEPSHFTRFAAIYRDWNAMGEAFAPAIRTTSCMPTAVGSRITRRTRSRVAVLTS